MSRHTERPWEAGKAHRQNNNSWCAVVFSPAKTGIFHTPRAAEALGVTKEEAEANAQLIAAAPDLLAACKRLAKQEDWEGEGVDPESPVGRAWAAIAKATE